MTEGSDTRKIYYNWMIMVKSTYLSVNRPSNLSLLPSLKGVSSGERSQAGLPLRLVSLFLLPELGRGRDCLRSSSWPLDRLYSDTMATLLPGLIPLGHGDLLVLCNGSPLHNSNIVG